MISMTTNKAQDDGDEWLPAAAYNYNSARRTVTGFAPYDLMYGRLPRSPGDLLRPDRREEIGDLPTWHQRLKQRMIKTHEMTRTAIRREQARQARYYNRGVRNGFGVRERLLVWIFRMPRGRPITKFKHQWRGPAMVMEASGFDNYLVR